MTSYAVEEAFGVRGQVAIVTGAGGFIGQGIAEAFAVNGAAVVLSDLPSEALTRNVRDLEGRGTRVAAIPADLTVESDLRQLIDQTMQRFGRLDVLINCGGIPGSQPLADETGASFDRLYHTNVRSLWLLTKFAAEVMPPTGGSIVNIASVNAHRALFFCSLYSGSKAAVIATTRELATELASRLIRVNSISPGAIQDRQRNWRRLLDRLSEPYRGEIDAEFGKMVLSEGHSTAQPLPLSGTPADIAMGCIYLCSPAARFVTGVDLVIDGGRLVEIPDSEVRFRDRGRAAWPEVRERLRQLPEAAWREKPYWLRQERAAKAAVKAV